MNLLTKDYKWYHDTPEQRFEWTPGSIWLINPETKQWVLQLNKDGNLWWYVGFYRNFQRYFNMERSDYEKFITIWVEDALNRGVSSTTMRSPGTVKWVEDALNRGVSSTSEGSGRMTRTVKDVLKNGKQLK